MVADPRVSRARGFTLVELLIAVAIFGLVAGIASFGYSLFTRQWEGLRGGYDRAQARYQRLDLVSTAIENTLPWVVRDETGRAGFYFLGRDEGLTLVTESPVFAAGAPAVIRLFREPVADQPGKWNLVYEEASLAGVRLLLTTQTLPFAHRMIVATGLPRPEFSYFGWRSLEERSLAGEAPGEFKPLWYHEFDGARRRQHPQRIGIELGAGKAVFFVPDRADVSLDRYAGSE